MPLLRGVKWTRSALMIAGRVRMSNESGSSKFLKLKESTMVIVLGRLFMRERTANASFEFHLISSVRRAGKSVLAGNISVLFNENEYHRSDTQGL